MRINTSCVKYTIYKSKQEAKAALEGVCVYLEIYEVPALFQREKVLYFFSIREALQPVYALLV